MTNLNLDAIIHLNLEWPKFGLIKVSKLHNLSYTLTNANLGRGFRLIMAPIHPLDLNNP